MNRLVEFITSYPRLFLLLSLLFGLVFSFFAPSVKTVDNVDYFTLENDPDVEIYNRIKDVFGNDEFFIVAFEKKNLFTKENLQLLDKLTREIEEIEMVRKVKSLANVDDTIGRKDYFEVRKFLESIPADPKKLEALKKEATNNPLYVKNLVSESGNTAAIVVYTYDRPDDEQYRKNLMSACRTILRNHKDTEFWISGWTSTNLYLSQYLKKDMAVFIPLTYLLITICVYFFFKNLWLTFLALANISICMGSTMGMFYLSGITLNNVTTIVPPLIMALALCDTVHIFSHMKKSVLDRFDTHQKALAHVLKAVALPCFLTTATTAAGFLSLSVSNIPPIREFSLMAACGMFFEFFFSFFFLCPLILLLPTEKLFIDYPENRGLSRLLDGISAFVKRYGRSIVLCSCFLIIASVWFAFKIDVETNLLEFFKKDSPVRTSLEKVEDRLSGISSVDISIQSQKIDAFKKPDNLRVVEKIQEFIARQPGVDVVLSFADFIKDINESFHNEDETYYRIPDSAALISQYMLLYDSEDTEDFINSDYSHARIMARSHEYSSSEQKKLIENIKNYIHKIDHKGLEIHVSGRAVQDVNTIDALVKGQIKSLSLAAGIIFVVMFFVLQSWKMGLVSVIPNLFPIVINFGIMGLFGIPLNTATSLISAVAIGIAVDDTIHFLHEYKEQRRADTPVQQAVNTTVRRKGRAIITSSVILCIGFGVMLFSRFMPIVNFGMLSAVIMVTAVIGDLVVLPSVLLLNKKQGKILSEKGV